MFTGLVEDVGTVVSVSARGRGKALTIRCKLPLHEVAVGDSIAVNGACLTAEHTGDGTFIAVAAQETLARTTLASVRVGDDVHLERAMRLGGRLDGHLVQGHVDGLGTVERSTGADESWVLWIRLSDGLERYVAAKGSICVDGVSLTVNEVDAARFRVNLVPHTGVVTRLSRLKAGQSVNIEVDILAKYLERLLGAQPGSGLTLERLKALGYTSPWEGR